MSARGKILRAAGAMSAATLVSRILGYIKDMVFAKFFGATGAADVFFVAFRIPNLLRELVGEGSMSSAFIPVLKEYQTRHGDKEAGRLVRAVFVFILISVGLICVIGIIFAPAIVSIIAPGFLKDPEKFSNAVLLTRIMFPFLLFISLAALTMGTLNTKGVFFIPSLSPAMFNVVVILSIFLFSMRFTNPITAAAIGVTVGGVVQFLFQLPSFFKQGYSFKDSNKSIVTSDELKEKDSLLVTRHSLLPSKDSLLVTRYSLLSFRHPGLKKIGLLIIPSTAGLAVVQINIFISTILASFLPEGSITYLYYATRLIQFPVGLFGVAMGMAILPALSEHSVKGEMDKLKEDFSFALRLLFFITVPSMIGLIALKIPIVSTLFQRGMFEYGATIGTSDALMFYAIGIWAIVGVKVTTSTFYSMQDTKTPMKIAVAALIINILMSLLLMGPLKHSGLAFANSIASCANFILLFYFLRKKIGGVGTKRIANSFLKTVSASAVMGIAGWFIVSSDVWALSGHNLQKALHLGVTITICMGVYILMSYLLKSEEMGYIIKKIQSSKLK